MTSVHTKLSRLLRVVFLILFVTESINILNFILGLYIVALVLIKLMLKSE